VKYRDFMCKRYTEPWQCVHRRKGRCRDCTSRDSILIHICDCCGEELSPEEYTDTAPELCAECLKKEDA